MANLRIEAPLVDGSLMDFIGDDDSCVAAVEFICGDDLRPPPRSVRIQVTTQSGRQLVLTIPNGPGAVYVTLDDEAI